MANYFVKVDNIPTTVAWSLLTLGCTLRILSAPTPSHPPPATAVVTAARAERSLLLLNEHTIGFTPQQLPDYWKIDIEKMDTMSPK